MMDGISQASLQSMLETLRAYQTQSQGAVTEKTTPGVNTNGVAPTFADAIKSAVARANDADVKADAMSEAYERGEDIPLTDVVLSMQKSSLAFEATLQVRNKVLQAYTDIMNMPV
jgi:flagellar hook-basal body complex protein FliE